MDPAALTRLLDDVRAGRLDPTAAGERIRAGALVGVPVPSSGGVPATAAIDHDRARRCGFPEVVFAPGKTRADLVAIAREIHARSGRLLVTRIEADDAAAVREALPGATFHARARALTAGVGREGAAGAGRTGIAIVTAGTADVPVAEEARVTAEAMGEAPVAIYDVGVAGLHRLLAREDALRAANVLIVVAGMEGALASVVGGLVDRPVVAVPSSAGYGTNLGGVTTLLAMMTSCAPNVSVVNVDNGFGAAYVATLINRTRVER